MTKSPVSYPLIRSQGDALVARDVLSHSQGRLAFRRAGCLGKMDIHRQAVPVLHQDMPHERQPGFLAFAFFVQLGLGIGGGGVGIVGPFVPVKIYLGITVPLAGRIWRHLILGPEAFQRSPGFDQRSVHGEMIVGEQPGIFGLFADGAQKHHRDVGVQDTLLARVVC